MYEREVKCPQCYQSIMPGDSVFSAGGPLLSHVNCQRPKTLTGDERALLFSYCLNHPVARCEACARSFHLNEMTADLLGGRTHLCRRCRRDLTESVRTHLYGCKMLPAEVRRRAQALREAAQLLVKETRELCDKADVLIQEAEAAFEENRRALWQSLKTPRRSSSVREIEEDPHL
jgi:hypothetical protein